MKSTSDPTNRQLLDELRQIVEKSIEANLKYIQSGSELFRHVAERRLDLSDIPGRGGAILNQAITEYVRTSAAITTQLIGLGVGISEELFGRVGQTPPLKPEGKHSRTRVLDIKMSGHPGTKCQTAFVVDCDRPEPTSARFTYSLLVDAAGEYAFDVPIHFDPPVVHLDHPGAKKKVVSGLELPPDMPPGLYHSIIRLKGLPDLNFRLLVKVEEPGTGKAASTKQKPTPRRRSGEKSGPTTKRKKQPTNT